MTRLADNDQETRGSWLVEAWSAFAGHCAAHRYLLQTPVTGAPPRDRPATAP
ncbi:hypothetical protein HEP86_35075 [Streptomyces sp. RPA4-5]|uniref:hypothetical protein n=1 Tax=Streptomyces sp. RPA4-5 TaxID=2721245 RepID=UPI00143EB0BB|nr:hypothetical protein [Streptomyces sp. RPA4-5]QIY58748.1 hypothetical protein HEP86_35075 [Streptomyces sp. RPA4-5]